jgi:preprotein translocase subunit SecG
MKSLLLRNPSLLSYFLLLGLILCEPALANKFETIGGGVQGSTKVKVEYLQVIAYVASGIFFISGVLAILLHNKNSQTLNYTMWKPSAAIFFILSILALLGGIYMK